MNDDFTQLTLNNKNLDRFVIRSAILNSLKNVMDRFSGRLLDVGCGKMPYKDLIMKGTAVREYVGLDLETAILYDLKSTPHFRWDGRNMPFEGGNFDCAIATEVLEHCPNPEMVLKEIQRVLKPGGYFFFTVPFLWNLHEVPHDEYRYTPFSLQRHLEHSGFQDVEIIATGGWHASMAQMLGLWVRRSPMKETKRNLLSMLIKPIIKFLIKIDKRNKVDFKEGQMITGLYGIARKSNSPSSEI